MEALLSGTPVTVRRGCRLQQNNLGLYDLTVNDENGTTIADVKNITFLRAVAILEDYMYQSGKHHEAEP